MYASLHVKEDGLTAQLLDLASRFSPEVEQSCSRTVVFSIAPLRQLIGSPHQIASEICRAGHEFKLQASLAIAANPDAALLLAKNFIGVTLVTPGDERQKLASIPLSALFENGSKLDPSLLEVLFRWGVKTCDDLVALPEKGVAERLSADGVYLRNLAAGKVTRPLNLQREAGSYEVRSELEHSLHLLEPLLFLLSRTAGELCHRLRAQSRAAREMEVDLDLDTSGEKDDNVKESVYRCRLEFPVPLDDPRVLLKLLQLHLERHPPGAPVRAFRLRLEPVEPRRVQGGIFIPSTPAAGKLQVTLARIAGMVGAENVGTPAMLNTHRPDAFANRVMPELSKAAGSITGQHNEIRPEMLRLAMRLYRPALQARVQIVELIPKKISASGVKGKVLHYAGPWKTAGEWWTNTAWSREEWDVALDDGALYRIYQESDSQEWFVYGVYD